VPHVEEVVTEAPRPEPDRIQRTRRSISANPLAGRAVRQSNTATLSFARDGCAARRRRLGVFVLGALPVTVMVLVVLALAGPRPTPGSARRAHPATVLGIVAILTLGVAVYNKGLTSVGP